MQNNRLQLNNARKTAGQFRITPAAKRPVPSRYRLIASIPVRRGAVVVEASFVLSVFLVILFGMFDLGVAVMRQNTLSEAVRLLARTTIVHGQLSNGHAGAWGPATISGTASGSSGPAAAVQPMLVGMDPSTVGMTVQWLDGDNQPGHRIQATLTYQYTPLVPFILGTSPINLSATSTMRIAH
jgi:Flp pilus assembly protein TadG